MVQSILLLSHSPAALLAPSDLRSARRRDVNQWVTTLHATDGETETRDKAAPAFGNVLFAFCAVSDRDPTTQPQTRHGVVDVPDYHSLLGNVRMFGY